MSDITLYDNTVKPERSTGYYKEVITYAGLHQWIRARLGKPRLCKHCGTTTAKKFEWANISGKYTRELTDWVRLCTSCHRIFDNMSKKAWDTRGRTKVERECLTCNKVFEAKPSVVARGGAKYCSHSCQFSSSQWRTANSAAKVGRKREKGTHKWLK